MRPRGPAAPRTRATRTRAARLVRAQRDREHRVGAPRGVEECRAKWVPEHFTHDRRKSSDFCVPHCVINRVVFRISMGNCRRRSTRGREYLTKRDCSLACISGGARGIGSDGKRVSHPVRLPRFRVRAEETINPFRGKVAFCCAYSPIRVTFGCFDCGTALNGKQIPDALHMKRRNFRARSGSGSASIRGRGASHESHSIFGHAITP